MDVLKAILGSKKHVVVITSVLCTIGAAVGLSLNPDVIAGVIGILVVVLVHAQGQADKGKEAAKIHLAAVEARDAKLQEAGKDPS